jgi:Peptidase family M23
MKDSLVATTLALLLPVFVLTACSDASSSSWNYGAGGDGSDGGGAGGSSGTTGSAGEAGAAGSGSGTQDAGSDGQVGPETSAPDATEQPWVQVTSPAPGATVDNPVTITFEGGGGVTHVMIEADDWPLHTDPIDINTGSLTYDFSGVGFERTVVATGLDAGGNEVATHQVAFTPVNVVGDLVFPIDLNNPGLTLSHFDSSSSTGSFGASRSGGRLHAGCDLYWTNDSGYAYQSSYYQYNNNKPIYAVADGTITAYYAFYQGTNAVEVDHGDFVIRYGEVDDGGLPNGLGVGSTVTAGQQIATMGDLDMSSGSWSMLHFELYSGDLSGSLTNSSNYSYLNVPDGNYQRRGDLLDCTPFLLDIMNQ